QLVPLGTLRNSSHRPTPLSEVRSSTQSTIVMPACLASSIGPSLPSSSPGRAGGAFSAAGSGGAGSFGSLGTARSRLQFPLGRPGWVQVLPDGVQGLGRVARGGAAQLAVEREARADLDVFAHHARVEAVQRPYRRPAHAAAEYVV